MAIEEQVYVELAKHFLGRFVAIGEALASLGGEGLWDPIERSFFDLLRREGAPSIRVKAFSVVGLVPLFATRAIDRALLQSPPGIPRASGSTRARAPGSRGLITTGPSRNCSHNSGRASPI